MQVEKVSWYYLLLLILAGESVFILPFVLARVFRPTVLEVFQLDNVQLGLCFSVYGFTALFSYILGGPIADRFPPRKLIAVALWMTAMGGWVYAGIPDLTTLKFLYGYWGFTTIFLFWAPMIKATRVWGGQNNQGKAFGFLDGGRGLVGALFGTLGVFIFSGFITSDSPSDLAADHILGFKNVIMASSVIVALVGVLVWFFLKTKVPSEKHILIDRISKNQIRSVLSLPSVWLLMIIILTAYVGYKMTDVFSLYASEVMLYDQIDSAGVGTFLLYIRPVIGIAIGFIADRSQITFWLFVSFILSFLGALLFATGMISSSTTILFFLSVLIVAAGVYAARALYFAVMQKGMIPLALTGTAVGLISLVGYTPDIFAGPMMGYFLDKSPGAEGHQHVFWLLALFAFIGSIAAWIYHSIYQKNIPFEADKSQSVS